MPFQPPSPDALVDEGFSPPSPNSLVEEKSGLQSALDYAVSSPIAATGTLTRAIELGAIPAAEGRRQAEKEKLEQESQLQRIRADADRGQGQLLDALSAGVNLLHELDPINLVRRTMDLPAQLGGSPYRVGPVLSPDQVRNFIYPTAENVGGQGESLLRAGSELASGLTSPEQPLAMVVGLRSPELVGRLFQIGAASQIPEATRKLIEEPSLGTAAQLAGSIAIPALIEKGITKPYAKDQIKSTSRIPSEQQSVPADFIPEGQTEGGTTQRVGAGEQALPPAEVQPEVTAATYTNPETGETTAAPNHPEAAAEQGVKAPETKTARETPEYGFEVTKPDGTKETVSRGTAETVAENSGQLLKKTETGKLHSDEVASPVEPSKPLSEVHHPEIKGMGGAVPGEFDVPQNSPTSTKNAIVDQERIKRDLPPAIQSARKEFGEAWDRAMARIDQNPDYQTELLNELRKKPRAVTDEENAAILQRQVDLQNEYAKATRDLSQAFEDGRTDAVDSEKLRVAQLSDQLLDIYNIGKKIGTETGRGLNSRKMMANEDFTLAKMMLDKRAANGGRPLTPAENSEIARLHQEIATKQKAYDDYVAQSEQRVAAAEARATTAELLRQQSQIPSPVIQAAERLVKGLDTRADAARARLKARMGRFSAGVDPTVLVDLAEIGASHIAHIGLDFAKWSEEMVKDLGEWVKPHLKEAFDASKKAIDSIGVKDEVKRAVKSAKGATQEDVRKQALADIKDRVDRKEDSAISYYVQKMARSFVASGIRDREQLIDAVHGELSKLLPNFTRRDTMDAISGYGQFKRLSKDEISTSLRGMKGEMQQLAKLEDMASGEPPKKTGIERRAPTDSERALIRAVNEAKNKFQIPVADPETQLKSALDTLKTALRNRITDLEDRIAKGDYSKRPHRAVQLDEQAMRLKAEAEKVKKKFQEGVDLDRFKNRQGVEKTADWLTRLKRFQVLSSPVSLAKLTAAAVERMGFTPIEEAIGSGIGKVVPQLAEKAPREGKFRAKAEARAVIEGFRKGMRDSWQTLKTGKSDLDILYGSKHTRPWSVLDVFGNIHGALKAVTKRSEFERSFQKRIEHAAENGVDVTNELVQLRTGIEAYKDANRSIFLQDNRVVSAFKAALASLERKSKTTGKIPLAGKAAATASRVLIPIVKVPTNIVAETLQYSLGTVTGLPRLALALSRGLENLKPEEADLIMRSLKKGSLGAAVMTLGYLNPDIAGGYYQRGEKRPANQPKVGSIRVYGHDVPSFWLHNPLLETLQIGATIRKVADSKLKTGGTKGLGEGIYAGALGVTEQVPFVREMYESAKLLDPREKNQFIGELGKSMLVPQMVQWYAQHTDEDRYGNPVKRAPKTITQNVETGIPGLRETVPPKRQR